MPGADACPPAPRAVMRTFMKPFPATAMNATSPSASPKPHGCTEDPSSSRSPTLMPCSRM